MRFICAFLLTLALAMAAPPAAPADQVKDLHHAAKALAADIQAQRRAQGIPDQAVAKAPLGSSKTVRFKLPMKKGKGRETASAYCFGHTLDCVARIMDPDNRYSGQVSTSHGSKIKFSGQKAEQGLDLTLQTDFFGDTQFTVVMEAGEQPWPDHVLVEVMCRY
ncbi:MAG: hypothetical protein K9K66_16010 [Desulfarculaceae bacterium]|nr:hypothetical protein [Desulfarculaceae bacterium]MCF8073608.1 hypothetical protein [Desulfarculaceae bacterium]MCF8103160.1 hypothetical protein [Desulfarculaceae bacterium]MCF8115676.1 hypothetical protein [Desulfarculaceae bacterium]